MGSSVPATVRPSRAAPDHSFHTLSIHEVVEETSDAKSFVLDVPEGCDDLYRYRAGQFLTFRAPIGGETYLRSYSMSSSPEVDRSLKVTVKRVVGGVVSNWMNDALGPGDSVEATRPAGVFCLGAQDTDVVSFAAGSGITPVMSIVKTALATTARRVHLLYANRDRESIIFAAELAELQHRHGDRLNLVHHLDVEDGLVDAAAVLPFAVLGVSAEYFICGPGPFMDIVERCLLQRHVEPGRIRIERFTPGTAPVPAPFASADAMITVELDGRVEMAEHHPGTTVLQMARQMGLSPPFSCESGSCATCMGRVLEGEVTMRVNNALTEEEVGQGWVLTCQAVPATPSVRVRYGYE